jgi:hypothetical protein
MVSIIDDYFVSYKYKTISLLKVEVRFITFPPGIYAFD